VLTTLSSDWFSGVPVATFGTRVKMYLASTVDRVSAEAGLMLGRMNLTASRT
jgi:hypothetical protein